MTFIITEYDKSHRKNMIKIMFYANVCQCFISQTSTSLRKETIGIHLHIFQDIKKQTKEINQLSVFYAISMTPYMFANFLKVGLSLECIAKLQISFSKNNDFYHVFYATT